MKAALLVRPGELMVDDIPDPSVGPDDVEIAVGGVGLCGSDLSVFSGHWRAPEYPWVMGHEIFGTVVGVGPGVSPERVGETVVVEPNIACLTCAQCQRGWTSACVSRQSIGMNRQGGLAERLVVPARFAWAIHGLGPTDLVCVEPATVALAALRRLGSPMASSALVVGAGAQGLLMSLVLQHRGTGVDVFDINPDRLAFAADLGARPLDLQPDRRFDLVVDTVGSPGSIETALGSISVGGTLLILGLDDRPLGFTAQTLVRRQLVVRGSLTYDHPNDFASSVAAISERRLVPGRIVRHAYALEEAQAAFEQGASAVGKSWIRISREG
jgi:alcohol dehydrogenase/L-iditol 2-dehydrogenase